MSHYRRSLTKGATFFFTVNLAERTGSLLVDEIDRFRLAYRTVFVKRAFKTIAICVLPDHLHAIWRLPEGDADFSERWRMIKRQFSMGLPTSPSRSESKMRMREKGIWQRRFWEHQIRDDNDLQAHVDYIHFNPVKHGLVARVREWPHSSFHRFVKEGQLSDDWGASLVEVAGEFGER